MRGLIATTALAATAFMLAACNRTEAPEATNDAAVADVNGSEDLNASDNGALPASDARGSDDRGSDDRGSDDRGSDDRGSDDRGSDDRGSDDRGSDDR